MKINTLRMHLILYFLVAEALTTRRSILYIQSSKDGKYLNLKGDFEGLDKIKHHFQAELETEKGAPPYIKIRDGKNRYLSVKDDTLWWTDEDLGFKWNSSFVETSEGMLSDQNGKCFAREGSQITLKNCNDIINDVDMSHFKLMFVPTEEEIKHARSVLEASKEQNRMLSRENNGARRGDGRSQYDPLDRTGDGRVMGGPRNGISDPLVCPMRGVSDGGLGPDSLGMYGTGFNSPDNLPKNWAESGRSPERDANVPPRGIEGTLQGSLSKERPVKDRNFDGTPRSYTERPLGREQGNAGDPYSTQDYSKALNIARKYADEQKDQNAAPLSKGSEHDEISSDPIKALNDLKRMLEENQRKVLREAERQKEKVKNDVDKKSEEVLNKLKDDISKLQRENEGRLNSPATRSTGEGSFPLDPLEEKHNDDQYKDLKKIKETLQNLQERLDPLLKRETSTSNPPSHGRRAG